MDAIWILAIIMGCFIFTAIKVNEISEDVKFIRYRLNEFLGDMWLIKPHKNSWFLQLNYPYINSKI